MPSPLCSVVLGGGTEWLCSHVLGTTGNALGRSRTRRSASTGGSRPVSLLREITQRLEQTSLPLTNQLLMAAHPTQWERCLGEGYQPWPLCSLFLPTNTARSLILTASCFWCRLVLTGSVSISSLNKYNFDVWSHSGLLNWLQNAFQREAAHFPLDYPTSHFWCKNPAG